MSSSSFVWLTVVALLAVAYVSAEGPFWTIYHSWNGRQDFRRRGVLQWKEEDQVLEVVNDENALTKEEVQAMLEYGWYHVKLQNGDNNDDYVLATVPACNLRRANFKDEFSVTLPRTSERVTSLAYTPLISPLAPPTCEEIDPPADQHINLISKVQAVLDTPGMTLKPVLPTSKPPPGLSFLKHPNTQKGSAGKDGDPTAEEPPQSFFRKYWYIILPLMLANLMGSAQPPPEGEPPQGESGQQAPPLQGGGSQTPAAPPAVASGVTSSANRRRGKRG